MLAVCFFVLSQSTRVTDRRTDGQNYDPRYRVSIAASASRCKNRWVGWMSVNSVQLDVVSLEHHMVGTCTALWREFNSMTLFPRIIHSYRFNKKEHRKCAILAEITYISCILIIDDKLITWYVQTANTLSRQWISLHVGLSWGNGMCDVAGYDVTCCYDNVQCAILVKTCRVRVATMSPSYCVPVTFDELVRSCNRRRVPPISGPDKGSLDLRPMRTPWSHYPGRYSRACINSGW